MAMDTARLGDEIAALDTAGADIFHWDIMDGHFVPNLTFGPAVTKAVRQVTEKEFDVHLMVTNPAQWIDIFIDAGAENISFHAETQTDALALVRKIKAANCKPGLALNPETSLDDINAEILAEIDRLLIMTVKPGFGGQKFIDQSDKIKQAAATYPYLDIMVDGGINLETAKTCCTAGATSLVSGSALCHSADRAGFIAALKAGA
ncbi:MAG: ribulosephosphate 3-epimerase [Alphaproteobacteria bacterium]|nr:ribulosephosphate 3-epimerase [Alphaproteobacteria bacterium]